MNYVSGVYGFDITQPIQLSGCVIEPLHEASEAHQRASDRGAYRLTAVLRGEALTPEFLFDLSAVLSFVEGMDVALSEPENVEPDSVAELPSTLYRQKRHPGPGAVIMRDHFNRTSRATFVALAMRHLQDQRFCERTNFRTLLFHSVEAFRQRSPFIELTWFLLFTALESHARLVQNAKGGTCPPILVKTLKPYGFDVVEHDPSDPFRSMSTYARLRNALFHNASREWTGTENGRNVSLTMSEHLNGLQTLVALTTVKVAGFDDGHINWNSWLDRMAFK